MRLLHPRGSLLLCLLAPLSGCYNPDYALGSYKCSDMDSRCPAGFSCEDGYCQQPKEVPGGCAVNDGFRNGFKVADGVYACRGKFRPGKARDLCDSAYELCSASSRTLPASCGHEGFFAARVTGCRTLAGEGIGCAADGECGPTRPVPLLLGCGRLPVGTYDYPSGQTCGGYSGVLDCALDMEWVCSSGLDGAENKDSDSGVLCCKRE